MWWFGWRACVFQAWTNTLKVEFLCFLQVKVLQVVFPSFFGSLFNWRKVHVMRRKKENQWPQRWRHISWPPKCNSTKSWMELLLLLSSTRHVEQRCLQQFGQRVQDMLNRGLRGNLLTWTSLIQAMEMLEATSTTFPSPRHEVLMFTFGTWPEGSPPSSTQILALRRYAPVLAVRAYGRMRLACTKVVIAYLSEIKSLRLQVVLCNILWSPVGYIMTHHCYVLLGESLSCKHLFMTSHSDECIAPQPLCL